MGTGNQTAGGAPPARGVLPPKSAAELERELQGAHAMIGRLMLLLFDRTDMSADDVMAALRSADSRDTGGGR